MEEVTTEPFSISTATHARVAISLLAGRWWWLVVIPPLVAVMLSVFNVALLFAAMIWIFMLLPPAVMFAYYSYLLQPVAARLSKPHYIVFKSDGNLEIGFPPDEEETDDTVTDTSMSEPITIPTEAITEISESGSNLLIKLHYPGISFLLVPLNVIPPQSFPIIQSIIQKS